ncbi:hypothetical protein SLEP1_g38386 [Rubroshorea leprosula]|nr:hypothetical protein SLEP1_g38386 [Rubroshorea leprosula]
MKFAGFENSDHTVNYWGFSIFPSAPRIKTNLLKLANHCIEVVNQISATIAGEREESIFHPEKYNSGMDGDNQSAYANTDSQCCRMGLV